MYNLLIKLHSKFIVMPKGVQVIVSIHILLGCILLFINLNPTIPREINSNPVSFFEWYYKGPGIVAFILVIVLFGTAFGILNKCAWARKTMLIMNIISLNVVGLIAIWLFLYKGKDAKKYFDDFEDFKFKPI